MRRLLFAAALVLLPSCGGADERPNIILIFSDDHSAQAISAYGSQVNRTPSIDRIAEEGMLFSRCFVTNSICGPSRAVILTGKHSHLNGQLTNSDVFDGSQRTYPKLLRRAGYQTALFGKWHLKSEPQGFDEWKVLIGQGPYYNPPIRTATDTTVVVGYTTELITDMTLEWLKDGRDTSRPFLLMFQHKSPHRPWDPSPAHIQDFDDVEIPMPETFYDDYEGRGSAVRQANMRIADNLNERDLKIIPPPGLTEEQLSVWLAAYEPRNETARGLTGDALVRWKYQRYMKDYLRVVASMDDAIGRLLDYLDESGLADNTVVVYTSDQGWYLGEHGWYDKRWMYEPSLRTPLVARWPGVTAAGGRSDQMVSNLDLAPTFLDIAGVPIPGDMQGRSLKPLLEGAAVEDWRQSFYYHYYEYPASHCVRRHYGVRTARHKLIYYYVIDEWELFDLETDPNELKSVYADPAYVETVADLKTELTRLREQFAVPEDIRPIGECSFDTESWGGYEEDG